MQSHYGYVNPLSMVPSGGFQGQMFEEQDQYLQERSNAMAQVESTIVELGDMFTQLATMVQGKHYCYDKPLSCFCHWLTPLFRARGEYNAN